MPTYNYGMGLRSNPMDAYNEMSGMVKQSRLAKMLGGYYQNGQADLGQIAEIDPQAAHAIQAEQQQKWLAALLGQAYNAPEDQRQGILAKVMGIDPKMGLDAVKTFDPRFAAASNGVPSEYQVFDRLARDANLSAEDRATAARRQLYLDPRPSNAAISYQKIVGADGRERLVAVDPRQVGAVDMSSGQAFGSGVGQGQPAPGKADMEADIALANQMIAAGIPAEQVDAFIAARGQRADAPGALPAGGAQFVGRTPEQQAALTEQAKADVQYGNMGRVGVMDAQNAGLKATEEARAKSAVEQALKVSVRARDDREQLMLLSEAAGLLKSATSGGAAELGRDTARYFGITTEGAKADAKLETIAGKLTGKVPRFEGPQSNIDVQLYQKMAGDLANAKKTRGERIAAAQGMIDLIKKYQNYTNQQAPAKPASGGALRYNPATGDFD